MDSYFKTSDLISDAFLEKKISSGAQAIYFALSRKLNFNSDISEATYKELILSSNIKGRETISRHLNELKKNRLIVTVGQAKYRLLFSFKGKVELSTDSAKIELLNKKLSTGSSTIEPKTPKNGLSEKEVVRLSNSNSSTIELSPVPPSNYLSHEVVRKSNHSPPIIEQKELKIKEQQQQAEQKAVVVFKKILFKSKDSAYAEIPQESWDEWIEEFGFEKCQKTSEYLEWHSPEPKQPGGLVRTALKRNWPSKKELDDMEKSLVELKLKEEKMKLEKRNSEIAAQELDTIDKKKREEDAIIFDEDLKNALKDKEITEDVKNLLAEDDKGQSGAGMNEFQRVIYNYNVVKVYRERNSLKKSNS